MPLKHEWKCHCNTIDETITPMAKTTSETEGVIISLFPLGETDKLVTLITPHHGLLRAVAKRVSHPRSRMSGHIDTLRHVSIIFTSGRHLGQITQADTVSSFPGIRVNLERFGYGMRIAELAMHFSEESTANTGLFELLIQNLSILENTAIPNSLSCWFDVKLLSISGYMPELFVCIECRNKLPEMQHRFAYTRGGFICRNCSHPRYEKRIRASVTVIKWLRFLHKADWDAVERIRIPAEDITTATHLLQIYLQEITNRTLKSEAFIRDVAVAYKRG